MRFLVSASQSGARRHPLKTVCWDPSLATTCIQDHLGSCCLPSSSLDVFPSEYRTLCCNLYLHDDVGCVCRLKRVVVAYFHPSSCFYFHRYASILFYTFHCSHLYLFYVTLNHFQVFSHLYSFFFLLINYIHVPFAPKQQLG